jgi:hypothetical protein
MKAAVLTIRRHRSSAGGVVLMEVLCAILIFGMSALALMKALTVWSRAAVDSQQELRMLLRVQSKINEISKYPRIEELEGQVFETNKDDLGVWTRAEVVRIENLENMEGQPLNEMFEILVTAFYDDFGRTGEVHANTIRYGRLYSTTTAAGGAPATPQPTR